MIISNAISFYLKRYTRSFVNKLLADEDKKRVHNMHEYIVNEIQIEWNFPKENLTREKEKYTGENNLDEIITRMK